MGGIKTIYLEKGRGADPVTGAITGPVKYFYFNGNYIAFWSDTSLSKIDPQEIGIKAGKRVKADYRPEGENALVIGVKPLDINEKKALKKWLGGFPHVSPNDFNVVSV